jgi:hypothetical protein
MPAWDRVKTDRRDAERLARLLLIGELPAVRVRIPAEEVARDLVRAREDAREDLMRTRHRAVEAAPAPGVGLPGDGLDPGAHPLAGQRVVFPHFCGVALLDSVLPN